VSAVTDYLTLQKALSQNERAVCSISFDIYVFYCKYTTVNNMYLTSCRLMPCHIPVYQV